MKPTTEERNAAVLAVLNSTKAPLGPTEIARRIDAPWCKRYDAYQSSVITPILKRIKAVRHSGGKYTADATFPTISARPMRVFCINQE